MKKIAKLITVTFVTRVIVEENDDDMSACIEAKPKLLNLLNDANNILENIESIVDDTECPYNPETDETGEIEVEY